MRITLSFARDVEAALRQQLRLSNETLDEAVNRFLRAGLLMDDVEAKRLSASFAKAALRQRLTHDSKTVR